METQSRAEVLDTFIYKGDSSNGACLHGCKCHRGLNTVCVVVCIFASLLTLTCAVFTSVALCDVKSLRDEVKALHDADCRPSGTAAGADSGERNGKSVELGINDVAELENGILATPDAVDENGLEVVHNTDKEDEAIQGSGDDFILLQDDDIEEEEVDVLHLLKRSAQVSSSRDTTSPANGKHRRNKGKGKKSRKAGKCGGGRKMKSIRAAQYEATVTDKFIKEHIPQYDHSVNTEDCRHFSDMNGVLCRNKSFTPDDEDVTSMFQPAPWVTRKTSPLSTTVTDPGVYTARGCGVYLVYAQVMFSDHEPIKGIIVEQLRHNKKTKYVESVQRLICNQGLALLPDMEAEQVMQSCSLIGLFKMQTGDVLRIRSENKYAKIERSVGSTYFGVVQLNKDK